MSARWWIVGVLLALVVSVAPAQAAAPVNATYDPYYGHATGWRPPTLMIGDSTMRHAEDTYRVWYRGELNGVSARSVAAAPGLVAERCRNSSPLRRVVFGLGTNGGSWSMSRQTLVNTVNTLKRCGVRKIVFVTPYRDPAVWGNPPWRGNSAAVVAQFAGWERQIAAKRHGVCTAEWAQVARPYLFDGVHYNAAGEQVHVRLVRAALEGACR